MVDQLGRRTPGNLLAGLLALALLQACSQEKLRVPAGQVCATPSFFVSDDFVGARRGQCTILSNRHVRLHIDREDDQVTNPSPWFAFRLDAPSPVTVRVQLDYGTWQHRYIPKISKDGVTWRRLGEEFVHVGKDGRTSNLQIDIDDGPVWIAAQELVTEAFYSAWYKELANAPDVIVSVLGASRDGRAITKLENRTESRDVVLLVGRQHPPEVTGALAMREFVRELYSSSDLGSEFRARYKVIAIPLMNPDGVAAGNWRHNSGGADLNRDWGPFEQPETRLISAMLDELDDSRFSLRVLLDFHSTKHNLFYTQSPEDVTDPPGFSDAWFKRARANLVDYPFTSEMRPTSDTPSAKNYIYKRYGIPAMTYEVGDETDRRAVIDSARVFAIAFMDALLEKGSMDSP